MIVPADIYIAATITSVLAALLIGVPLFTRTEKDEKALLAMLVLALLPMNALAFYCVRLPADSLVVASLGKGSEFRQIVGTFYAPLTEEPAKLLILLIPWVCRRVKAANLVRVAFAIGLGFGVGEAWTVATLLAKSPEIAKYPWYMLGGYMGERMMVCVMHAAFTAAALHFIVRRTSVVMGVAAAMLLHYLGNFPIFLARANVFGLGDAVWAGVLQAWVLIYFLLMGGMLSYMAYGNEMFQKIFKGKMRCPECGEVYERPIFKVNLLHKCYERCPCCRRWHMVSAFDYEEKKTEQ